MQSFTAPLGHKGQLQTASLLAGEAFGRMCEEDWAKRKALRYGIWEHRRLAGSVSLEKLDWAAGSAQVSALRCAICAC